MTPYLRRDVWALVGSSLVVSILLLAKASAAQGEAPVPDRDDWSHLKTGAQVFRAVCASCHGADGAGAPQHALAFETPLPDFTDCSFASREPQADWFAIAHNGGPTRGFDEMMPAFGGALTEAQVDSAATHLKTFCEDKSWPDGVFNLPRPLSTGKAFLEDEAVWEYGSTVEEPVSMQLKFVFEKRVGDRHQVELILPVGVEQHEATDGSGATNLKWGAGLGDPGVAWKSALWHSPEWGSIGSLGVEVFIPVGDETDGFSKGIFRFEPFVAIGQVLPGDNFAQLHAGAELSTDEDVAGHEVFWRAAVGHTFTQGQFGRAWSPMVEVLGVREIESGATIDWSVVPELHVTLNQRQHVMLVLGVEIPVTDFEERQLNAMMHLLWDWYDGGFTEGW
ncbi:c-type cytochrome [Myxococcota bacterium]